MQDDVERFRELQNYILFIRQMFQRAHVFDTVSIQLNSASKILWGQLLQKCGQYHSSDGEE